VGQYEDAATAARAFISKHQTATGGWPYRASAAPMTEPTSIALLAMRADPSFTPARERARAALLEGQHADGGWGVSHADTVSQWHTSWAILALAHTGAVPPSLPLALTWLRGNRNTLQVNERNRRQIEQTMEIDISIRGWPWGPNEAPWVEPTALALMALHTANESADSPDVVEGVRYLLDRRCVDGGWNIGNPKMLGNAVPPRAHATGVVLLALRPFLPAEHPAIVAGLAATARLFTVEPRPLSLAWGLLALGAWGQQAPAAVAQLVAKQRPDGSWEGDIYITAAALMALDQGWPLGTTP
jgi:hypothetical protein